MNILNLKPFLASVLVLTACTQIDKNSSSTKFEKGSYGYDADFVRKHTTNSIELHDKNNQAKVLLSAEFQGRVMTSTASGDTGASYGWVNYQLISSGKKKIQFNPVGGEERFWLGPEGGQFSIYFKKNDSFNLAHWQVPAVIDTVAYDILQSNDSTVVFSKTATLVNYSGTTFDVSIRRSVSLLDKNSIQQKLNADIPADVYCVGYETNNQVNNIGRDDWTKESGLLSIWLLGMMTPTQQTKVIIPFKPIAGAHSLITMNYFGDIPKSRLEIQDSILYFTCDGKYRSKIGLSPLIAKSIAASFDFDRNVLTVILFPVDKLGKYVNSKWELQKEPYKGDVVNSYNDGPLADGTQLGPFYEIESSSSVKELKRGETEEHKQITCHLQGNYESLRQLAIKLLGVDLNNLKR
ncbi:MAG TPA: DUF6786 family protein [Chitinophagaceae bacterium]|nr:DUF6786 family protein [Chitinophagaceae bacterium]